MKYRSFRNLVLGLAYLEENKLEEAVPVRVISWAKLKLIAKPIRISVEKPLLLHAEFRIIEVVY